MILDLSVLVDGTTQGPPAAGSPPVVLETHFRGPGHWQSSRIAALLHAGSHVDAPLHVVADGKAIDAVALDEVNGTAVLIDVHDAGEREAIDARRLEKACWGRKRRFASLTSGSVTFVDAAGGPLLHPSFAPSQTSSPTGIGWTTPR